MTLIRLPTENLDGTSGINFIQRFRGERKLTNKVPVSLLESFKLSILCADETPIAVEDPPVPVHS